MTTWQGASVPELTESVFFNAARRTTFLLVEGRSDESFWLARVDESCCQVRAMGGRQKALDELETAMNESRLGVLAVLDADFDRIEGSVQAGANVIWTDMHDLEVMLLMSPALEKLLSEVASRNKLEAFKARERISVREKLLELGRVVGALRRHSRQTGLNLSFRKEKDGGYSYVDYSKFCDKAKWAIDSEKMIQTVLNFSNRHDLKVKELLTAVSAQLSLRIDDEQLCVGHDLVAILAIGLRASLGTNTHNPADLEERLRLAYEGVHLQGTDMYRSMRAWEIANPGFPIFPV